MGWLAVTVEHCTDPWTQTCAYYSGIHFNDHGSSPEENVKRRGLGGPQNRLRNAHLTSAQRPANV